MNAIKNAYDAACEADRKFQQELKRQFGANAGDFRYMPKVHDIETTKARENFKSKTAEMRAAMRGE